MGDSAVTGLAVAVLLIAVASGVGMLASRWWRPGHTPVSIGQLEVRDGVILFTATDCSRCAEARVVLEATGREIREVTFELEPAVFATSGVEAVPLSVVVDHDGTVVAQFSGVPPRRALDRALAKVVP